MLLISITQTIDSIRRLHDLNASGDMVCIANFYPFWSITHFMAYVKKRTDAPNQYGPPPEY